MKKVWLVFTEYDDIEACESAEVAKARMKQIIEMAMDEDCVDSTLQTLEQHYEETHDDGYFEVGNGWLRAERLFMYGEKDFEKEN